MAKVFANGMVAHVWAQQSQEEGRSHNGNFRFSGPTIYSYATPIANFVEGVNGQRVALLTSETYSITTSAKHMGPVWRALDYGRSVPAFSVPFLGASGGRSFRHPDATDLPEVHKANAAFLASRYDEALAHLLRCRAAYEPRRDLVERADSYRRYCGTFGLDAARVFDVDSDAAKVVARFERLGAKEKDPKEIAKRERAAARRAEREQERLAEAIEKWRSGELYAMPHDYSGPILLRVRGEVIETTRHASFPTEHGIKAFRLIRMVRERGEAYQRNGHTIHLGHFVIDRIEPTGDVRAGCHFVKWGEIERCARELGLIQAAA